VSLRYFAKHMFVLQLSKGGEFRVHFDSKAPGVYSMCEAGILAFGGHVPCNRLRIDDYAIHADLRFDGEWVPVRITWASIRSVLSVEKTAALKAGSSSLHGAN
jgi:hypothetical protein